MAIEIDYDNPEKLPLEQLSFQAKNDGVKLVRPALSKEWVVHRPHIKYLPLNTVNGDEALLEEWLTKAEWFNKDMQWLIQLEHHRFWSNLVYEPKCITSVVSFLQEATPSYISIKSTVTDERALSLYADILKHVLTILCRMVTHKETETEWMTKEHLAKLLYDNFLFSVPMIFDILTVYGRSNSQIIQRIIESILKVQPKYRNDLIEGLNFLGTAFDSILEKVNENNPNTFDDLVLYILDCAYTLNTLVLVVPICRQIKIEQKVTKFYDNVIPTLHKNISYIYPKSKVLSNLNFARVEMINFFRHLANEFLQEVLNDNSADKFLDILQEALSENSFIVDYQRLNPVEDDIELLKRVYPKLDKFKLDFIKQAYTADNETFLETFVDRLDNQTEKVIEAGGSSSSISGDGSSKPTDSTSESLDNEIQTVRDMLPDLEVDFIKKLLRRYETTEQAITAYLECNLPPDLDETIKIDSPTEASTNLTQLMESLDLKEDTQITSKHIKSQAIKAKAEQRFLNDKSHIKDFHSRNIEYGYVDDEYDDEYDDSYDALTESETKAASKILRNTGAINEVADDIVDSETESEEEPNGNEGEQRDKSRDFCENPEAVRERWARNREAKYGAKRPPRQTNVVGNPKGQGQDKSTLVDRKKKSENKSSRGNHNRRQGAAFKRNRGMIPS